MNRVIKYRAWDALKRRMVEVCGIDFSNGLPCVIHTKAEREVTKSDTMTGSRFILMQFTGLLDKNGREIFEGDILRSTETEEVYRIDEILPAHRHDHSTNIGYFAGGEYHTRDLVASRYTGDDWMSWPEIYEVIGIFLRIRTLSHGGNSPSIRAAILATGIPIGQNPEPKERQNS